jgi:ubiquinone/menaquinone biosynthesis C-methylase UbiE
MNDRAEVREWWADRPMTYGETHGEAAWGERQAELGTKEFFDEVDRRFYEWNDPLHGDRPFSRLFPYGRYRDAAVLEVGCGMGTMAMNWARAGARVTAVDLNPTAVAQTSARFELLDLNGRVEQADGRALPFADGEFDYAWSWGVLHHSPDLERSLHELLRVVRPGGEFGLMLYNRRSFLHWYLTEYIEGFLHRERRFLSPLELASRYSDGGREEGNPHTWPVTEAEIRTILDPHCSDVSIRVLGTDLDGTLAMVLPGLDRLVPRWAKKPWARRLGWSLWFSGSVR